MSTSSTNQRTNPTSTLRRIVKAYIDNGNLSSQIMEDGCPLFQHYSFFGYNADTSTVRILLTGKSPADEDTLGGNVHRNVINTQYCAAIVCPIIKEKFPRVRDVECLLSGDPEFGDAVRAKGGRIEHPNIWNNAIKWHESMRYYGGIHPDVQGCINTVINKSGGSVDNTSINGLHNTPDFFNRFEMVWFVTDDSRVMGRDGKLLQGKEQIMAGVENIPDALELREIAGPARYAVVTDTAEFFSDEVYKIVVF